MDCVRFCPCLFPKPHEKESYQTFEGEEESDAESLTAPPSQPIQTSSSRRVSYDPLYPERSFGGRSPSLHEDENF